ncbi:hypothetical protein DL98DRAFT_570761 [Cadophora sp. DSE1049]|nr:hypothetical protein DL98DRAFT_570761 [Cadophora sp. DSE1049]
MPSSFPRINHLDRWPSWLWRQVKVSLSNNLLVTKVAWVRPKIGLLRVHIRLVQHLGDLGTHPGLNHKFHFLILQVVRGWNIDNEQFVSVTSEEHLGSEKLHGT